MVIIFRANDLQSELLYCLAVVKSAELNIIGRKSLNLQVILNSFGYESKSLNLQVI